jgi:hypothetical protein
VTRPAFRAIGWQTAKMISSENKLLRLIASLKQKRQTGEWCDPLPASQPLERFNKSGSQDGKVEGKFREVLDCGSPLPLFSRSTGDPKRQRAAAVQDAGARFDCPGNFGGSGVLKNASIFPG